MLLRAVPMRSACWAGLWRSVHMPSKLQANEVSENDQSIGKAHAQGTRGSHSEAVRALQAREASLISHMVT